MDQAQKGTAGAAHVLGADQLYGQIVENETANPSTTIQVVNFPSGATAIEFQYIQGSVTGTTTATGRAIYVVLNATSLEDATGKLALAGARRRIPLGGNPWGQIATSDSPITNAYFVSEVVETGHSTLNISARIPS